MIGDWGLGCWGSGLEELGRARAAAWAYAGRSSGLEELVPGGAGCWGRGWFSGLPLKLGGGAMGDDLHWGWISGSEELLLGRVGALRSSVVEVSGSGCSWEELNCWDELGLGLWLGEAGSGRNSGEGLGLEEGGGRGFGIGLELR